MVKVSSGESNLELQWEGGREGRRARTRRGMEVKIKRGKE